MKPWLAFALASVLLAGCQDSGSSSLPAPIALTEEAAGHYCQMVVLDHPGPKGQAHLVGLEHPLWFSQVRDALAFDRMPEKMGDVTVIYVNDMGKAASWDEPGTTNWIDARDAFYVQGSSRRGGMGAPELVPFAEEADARRFAETHGGSVLLHDDITAAMVLGPVDVDPDVPAPDVHSGDADEVRG